MQTGAMTQDKLITILNGSQPGASASGDLLLSAKKIRQYFPPTYSRDDMRDVIEKLLKAWSQQQEEGDGDGM